MAGLFFQFGDNFCNISSAFRAFFAKFCQDISPCSVHFFQTVCFNFELFSQHYCPYFSPVFAHLHLNFCSNWCLVVGSVCLLITPSFQTSITIVEVSCESDKSLFFSTTQLDVFWMLDLCLCSIQRSELPSTNRLYNSTSSAISQSDRLGRNMNSNCKIRRGFFQWLWSTEDPEGNNIRYVVYAYIPSN